MSMWTALTLLAPLVLIVSVPWLLSIAAMIGQGYFQRRLLRSTRSLSTPARQWLERQADRQGMATRVEVHATLAEAYFPHADTVGLSPTAAASAHPVHRAMVAHELGHAATANVHPLLRSALPAARLAIDGLPFAVTATLLVGALHQSYALIVLCGASILAMVMAQAIVVIDEASASLRARAWLRRDLELTDDDIHACGRSLIAALSAYAVPALGWLALLIAFPWIADLALSGPSLGSAEPLNATGTWLLLLLGPALLLHAGLVIAETVKPDPVKSAFQLGLRQERQHQWGFTAGICSLAVALGVAGWGEGLAFELALALAVFTGLEPASVLLRAALLLPAFVVAKMVGLGPWMDRTFEPPSGDEESLPSALASLWENPPWFLRGARLLQLSWVPLVCLVIAQALTRVP